MSRKNEGLEKPEQRQEDQAEIRLIQHSANELPRQQAAGYWRPIMRTILIPIGVGNGFRRPRPPNRACGSPAHGSPVGSFLIGIGLPVHGPRSL